MLVLRTRSGSRRGYSLIELVVVLTILAIVAGVTVSIVGYLRRSADKGTAANVMGSLLSNIELYRVTYGVYPDRFDSLIETGGSSLYDGDPAFNDKGLPSALMPSGDAKITTSTLTAGELSSLTKIGITTVMDHAPGTGVEGAPGNTGTVARTLASDPTVAILNAGSAKGAKVIDSIYPNAGGDPGSGLPPGVKLVVFGFGPNNAAIGKTIVSPPSYSGVGDPSTIYDRYLCVFAVYADGKRAQLKSVLDTTGDYLFQEIAEFHDNKPE